MPSEFASIFNVALIFMALRVTTPILLAAMGGLLCELTGVVNIALEGMMLFSALIAILVGTAVQSPWLGLLAAIAAGVLMALVLAFVHLHLQADEIIIGIAMNIFAVGFTVFLMSITVGDKGSYTPPNPVSVPNLPIPGIAHIPIIGTVLDGPNGQGLNLLTYLALLAVPLIHWFLYKTTLGLRMRAVGENAQAAQSVGIPVRRMKYLAWLLSGILGGLAGAFMTMAYLNMFVKNMTAGRGFIALAAVLLGGRRPLGTFLAALLFGFAEAVSNVAQSLQLPSQLVTMFPYVVTVVTLTVFAVRDYRRKQRLLASQAA